MIATYKAAEGKKFKSAAGGDEYTITVKYAGIRSLRTGEPRHIYQAERFNRGGRSVAIWTPPCKEFLEQYTEITTQ